MTEKDRQVVLYFVKNNPKSSVTSLMKLAYLADLISTKRYKKQITDFEYTRYHYGPFDKDIYTCIEDLSVRGIVKAESDYGLTGEEFSVYSVAPDEAEKLKFDKINVDEKAVLDELLGSVRGFGAKALTEIAYKTKPMKKLKATIGGDENLGKKLDLNA